MGVLDGGRPEWHGRAACRGLTALFFPEVGDTSTVREARKVCASCKVIDECRQQLDTLPVRTAGIWAGTTQRQRDGHARRYHERLHPLVQLIMDIEDGKQ